MKTCLYTISDKKYGIKYTTYNNALLDSAFKEDKVSFEKELYNSRQSKNFNLQPKLY